MLCKLSEYIRHKHLLFEMSDSEVTLDTVSNVGLDRRLFLCIVPYSQER